MLIDSISISGVIVSIATWIHTLYTVEPLQHTGKHVYRIWLLFCFVHQLGPSVIIIVVGFSLGVAVEKDFTFPFVHAIVHVPTVSP